jgi:hypothetical protein
MISKRNANVWINAFVTKSKLQFELARRQKMKF